MATFADASQRVPTSFPPNGWARSTVISARGWVVRIRPNDYLWVVMSPSDQGAAVTWSAYAADRPAWE
jgi:hypothetical protein